MTDDELIAKAERELATLTMCMSPDEVAKLEAHRLIALARIGASVMPRPLAAAPPASPAPVDDGERVRAAKIEAFDEALSIAEGSYSYGEQQNEIIAGIRAALAAIKGVE